MDQSLSFKLPKDKKAELKELSVKTGVQMGSLVRKAVYELLEREK